MAVSLAAVSPVRIFPLQVSLLRVFPLQLIVEYKAYGFQSYRRLPSKMFLAALLSKMLLTHALLLYLPIVFATGKSRSLIGRMFLREQVFGEASWTIIAPDWLRAELSCE